MRVFHINLKDKTFAERRLKKNVIFKELKTETPESSYLFQQDGESIHILYSKDRGEVGPYFMMAGYKIYGDAFIVNKDKIIKGTLIDRDKFLEVYTPIYSGEE